LKKGSSTLLITPGDVNGIGPELFFKSYRKYKELFERTVLVGSKEVFENYTKLFSIEEDINYIKDIDDLLEWKINILDVLKPYDIETGKITKEAGLFSYKAVEKAIELYKESKADAIITLPICKESWYKAGIRFPGHTEVFASSGYGKEFSMIMYSPKFSVILVSIHESIKDVPSLITKEAVAKTVRHALEFGDQVYGDDLSMAVCSLNPHGGEGGNIGEEEKHIIDALKSFYDNRVPKIPLAADTLFYHVAKKRYNMVVCMYHDQGLIPFKMNNFDDGVNVTWGTGIKRTSPDHGTAFDIAGKGVADTGSFVAAIRLAKKL